MSPQQALTFSMVLHELATNAVKYGALSVAAGKVEIDWERQGRNLRLTWREFGGPPISESRRTGFGSRLITRGLATHGGVAQMTFARSGLICTVECQVLPA